MDLHSLQAITVHCIPAHHIKKTLSKNLAGDLTALSLVCLHNAPAYRITGTDVTGTDNQFLFCGIDQKLNVCRILQLADTGVIECDACATDCHSRVEAMGDEG